jgi:hypothetical protein
MRNGHTLIVEICKAVQHASAAVDYVRFKGKVPSEVIRENLYTSV